MIILYIIIALLNEATYVYLNKCSEQSDSTFHNSNYKHTTHISKIPYHVLVTYKNLFCSGSIIRSRMVITAASCFVKWSNQNVVVKVGSDTITGYGQVIGVLEIKKHEYFNTANLNNDIALLMLKHHVTFSEHVQKIIIPIPKTLLLGTTLETSGWLHLDRKPAKYGNTLLLSKMIVQSPKECHDVYPHSMSESNFCVRYSAENKLLDNGGPATNEGLLVGIYSYSRDSKHGPFVAVITNVSYFFRWIHLNTERLMRRHCIARFINEDHYADSTAAILWV